MNPPDESLTSIILLADTCWGFGCQRNAYLVLVRDDGHAFLCRACAVEKYGEDWVVSAEKLRERSRTVEFDA